MPLMWVFRIKKNVYWQALSAGGAGKPGVWQLPWGIKQEEEKSLGRKQQAHQARPGQVPVLQQPHQSQTGWKLCGISAAYLWPFSTIAPCFLLEMVQCGWWWVMLRERSNLDLLGLRECAFSIAHWLHKTIQSKCSYQSSNMLSTIELS